MIFTFERLIRTASSEQYGVYTEEQDLYSVVEIHYGETVEVSILLLMEDEEGVDEEVLTEIMHELEGQVILSYSEEIEEIFYTVSVGSLEAEYSVEFDD